MRIIARRTLREFVDSLAGRKHQPAVKADLEAWFDEVKKARWTSTADVRQSYATASIVTAERIVFNVKGNAYRLVVSVDFEKGIGCFAPAVPVSMRGRPTLTFRSTLKSSVMQ